jgi:hypothetical protein
VSQKKWTLVKWGQFVSKSSKKIINHPFNDLYVKIYTIGYYSGFYSSLKETNWANGGHFALSSKDEEEGYYLSCMYQTQL